MTASKIEWTDRSDWNPIRGCTRVSPGCGGPGDAGGCYAEAIAARFSDPGQPFHGFATRTAKGPRWTGKVEVMWDRFDLPLRWRQPARIFASSTSDFFHDGFASDDVAQLFGVMIAGHHLRGHTFQVLTKRPARMRELLTNEEFWEIANTEAGMHVMALTDPLNRRSDDARATLDDYGPHNPPPGIWLGVSVEDQQRADERIPDLLATPAALRFLSCEPLLGPIDLERIKQEKGQVPARYSTNALFGGWQVHEGDSYHCGTCARIDWVIVGGESGRGARPMHPDWARSLRDQCAQAGVPFYFKQWGEWRETDGPKTKGHNRNMGAGTHWLTRDGVLHLKEARFSIYHEYRVARLGKKRAGRQLDGVEHNGMPGGEA